MASATTQPPPLYLFSNNMEFMFQSTLQRKTVTDCTVKKQMQNCCTTLSCKILIQQDEICLAYINWDGGERPEKLPKYLLKQRSRTSSFLTSIMIQCHIKYFIFYVLIRFDFSGYVCSNMLSAWSSTRHSLWWVISIVICPEEEMTSAFMIRCSVFTA